MKAVKEGNTALQTENVLLLSIFGNILLIEYSTYYDAILESGSNKKANRIK